MMGGGVGRGEGRRGVSVSGAGQHLEGLELVVGEGG